jgi:hypothetical protein
MDGRMQRTSKYRRRVLRVRVFTTAGIAQLR